MYHLILVMLLAGGEPQFLQHPQNPFPDKTACEAASASETKRLIDRGAAHSMTRPENFDFTLTCVPLPLAGASI